MTWTPRQNLSCEINSPWSTEGPDFMNNESQVAICWQRLLTDLYTKQQLILNSVGFPSLCPAYLCHMSQHSREPLVLFFYLWTETCHIPLEVDNLDTSFMWNGLNWNLGVNFPYERQPSLSLSGAQFKLLPESVFPKL